MAIRLFCIDKDKILSALRQSNTEDCHSRLILVDKSAKLLSDFYSSSEWSVTYRQSKQIASTPLLFISSMHSTSKRLNNKDSIKFVTRKSSRSYAKGQWLKYSKRVSGNIRKLVDLVKEINIRKSVKTYTKDYSSTSKVS